MALRWPWVSRRAYELVLEQSSRDRVFFEGQLAGLQKENRDLQNAAFVNARLYAPHEAMPLPPPVEPPGRLSVDKAAQLANRRSVRLARGAEELGS